MAIAKEHQDRLPELKKMVHSSHDYFKENYKSFNLSKEFVFCTTMSPDDDMALELQQKPKIEINIVEPFLSRQVSEFAKNMPSINVGKSHDSSATPDQLEFLGGSLRYALSQANSKGFEYQTYRDCMNGFSVARISTKYSHPMSWQQDIQIGKAFDPTLCGFDPLARDPHKGDGNYCFELYPMRKDEFERKFGMKLDGIQFNGNLGDFAWSYCNQDEEIILVCDLFEKKKKRIKIYQVVGMNKAIKKEDYEKLLEEWGDVSAPPAIINERWTEVYNIVRYRFIENQVLDYKETYYPGLPLVFMDGNSVVLQPGNAGNTRQVTRSYIKNAVGLQKLYNVAIQNLTNYFESLGGPQVLMPISAIPDQTDYIQGWRDLQLPGIKVYQDIDKSNPSRQIQPPIHITASSPPSEVLQTISMAPSILQVVLGSYDASLGINDNQLSGIAITEGATQSNGAAMPWVINYMQSLTQIGQLYVELLPRCVTDERMMSTIDHKGQKIDINVNGNSGIKLDYSDYEINVEVEAGLNFAVQKTKTLQQINSLSHANPEFQAFFSSPQMGPYILDNLEIRNIDKVKEVFNEWSKQRQQQQAQSQQMAMQLNPNVMKAKNDQQKLMLESQQNQFENSIKTAELAIDKQKADDERAKMLHDIQNAQLQAAVTMDKASAEKARAAADLAIKEMDISHKHIREHALAVHKMSNPDGK